MTKRLLLAIKARKVGNVRGMGESAVQSVMTAFTRYLQFPAKGQPDSKSANQALREGWKDGQCFIISMLFR